MPRVLSKDDVAGFRDRLCAAAEMLFAERGPDGVTMRQLASALGVSAMTPYRYFKDKDEILAAVRTNGFNRFAEAVESAFSATSGPIEGSYAVADSYRRFAFEHPQVFKLMFDLNQPTETDYPELVAAERRAFAMMTQHVHRHIAAGAVSGDAVRLGALSWAAIHGVVVLELAGKLPRGGSDSLVRDMGATLLQGLGVRT